MLSLKKNVHRKLKMTHYLKFTGEESGRGLEMRCDAQVGQKGASASTSRGQCWTHSSNATILGLCRECRALQAEVPAWCNFCIAMFVSFSVGILAAFAEVKQEHSCTLFFYFTFPKYFVTRNALKEET